MDREQRSEWEGIAGMSGDDGDGGEIGRKGGWNNE